MGTCKKGVSGSHAPALIVIHKSKWYDIIVIFAITPHRLRYGVIDADIWKRNEKSPLQSRRNKPINEKESHHWLS